MPITKSFSSTMTATISVGYTGSVEIKEIISSSVSAQASYTYSETVTSTVTIPAKTYWSRQAYAYKKTENYTGTLATWTLSPAIVGTVTLTPKLVDTKAHNGTNTRGDGGGIDYKSS